MKTDYKRQNLMIWLGQLDTAGVLSIMSSNLLYSSLNPVLFIDCGRVKSQQFGAILSGASIVMYFFRKSDSVALLHKRNRVTKSLSGQHLFWDVIFLVFRQFPQLQT